MGEVVETFTITRLGIFKRLGGYDASLRYCEGLDLAARMEAIGLDRVYDPSIVIRHKQIDIRGAMRGREVLVSTTKLLGRYLLGRYRPHNR